MEMKFQANDLRKKGQFADALKVYREVRGDDSDPYIIAGLLHCLRKLGQHSEAFPFCDIIYEKHLTSQWCKIEAVWTLIQGQLDKLEETAPIEQVCKSANNILRFEPIEITARWYVVKRVLKAAKSRGQWKIVSDWVVKIEPLQLSNEAMKDESGREGWSNQAIWHNLNIRSMIEIGDKERAANLAREACELFPRQRRFFARLEALATLRLARLVEAEKLYAKLCHENRPDWWVLHEYAQVLKDLGKSEIALDYMCKAAVSHQKIEALVSLFQEIGCVCLEMGHNVTANNHFLLCKFVREDHKWSIPVFVEQALTKLSLTNDSPTTLKESLLACKTFWHNRLGAQIDARSQPSNKSKMRNGLTGKVEHSLVDRPFCFIASNSHESFFCFKGDLPKDASEGSIVAFDAIPSFDKKKNRESWKAVNIRKTTL